MSKRVLGVYNSSDEVIPAIEKYRNQGYSVSDMSIVSNSNDFPSSLQYETGVSSEDIDETNGTRENKGFLDSLVSAFEGNSNTGEGTSYYDHFVGFGIDDAAAREYENDINSGRIILLGDTNAGNFTDTTSETVPGTAAGAFTGTTSLDRTGLESDTLDTDEERSLKLREEQLDVSKERVQTGEVEVHKNVVEEQKRVNVPVEREEVYVERRAVDGDDLDTTPLGDDETIRVPIVEEKVEVTKKPVVTEELVIGKKKVTDTEQVVENVKREEANIETDGETDVDDSTLKRNRLDNDRF